MKFPRPHSVIAGDRENRTVPKRVTREKRVTPPPPPETSVLSESLLGLCYLQYGSFKQGEI